MITIQLESFGALCFLSGLGVAAIIVVIGLGIAGKLL